jgi:O-antigen ligase
MTAAPPAFRGSPVQSLLWIGVLILAGAAAAVDPRLVSVPLGIVGVILVRRWPKLACSILVFVVLAVRPSLDTFSERRVSLGLFTLSPSVVLGLVVLATAATLAIQRAKEGHRLWPVSGLLAPFLWLISAYLIGMGSGVLLHGSVGLAVGARELVRIASIISAFLLVLWWAEGNPTAYFRGWTYLLVGLLVPVGVGVYQYATGSGFLEPPGFYRINGTFSHPNSFAAYLVPFILVAVAGLPHSRGWERLGRIGLVAGLSALVAFTYSRTAVLVLAAGLVTLLILQTLRIGWQGLLKGVLVVALVFLVGWLLAGNLIRSRFADITIGSIAWDEALLGASENSFTWRLITWRVLLLLGLEHPITGHGLGMTSVLDPVVDYRTGIPFHAHNDFVQFFFEGGTLSLLCYVIYGVLLCRWALRRSRAAPDWRAPDGFGVTAALVALMFLSLGAADLNLSTASLHGLYGMVALVGSSPGEPHGSATPAWGSPHPQGSEERQ